MTIQVMHTVMSENNKPVKKATSALAIVSLVLGIIAIALSFIPIVNNAAFVFGIIGLIFGIIGVVKSGKKALGIAAVILCAASMAITLALQASWSKSLNDAAASISADTNNAAGGNTDSLLKNDIQVTLGTWSDQADEYNIHTTELPVSITNISSEDFSGTVSIEALDADGNRINSDTCYIDSIAAGQSQDFKVFEYTEDDKLDAMAAASFNIYEVTKY